MLSTIVSSVSANVLRRRVERTMFASTIFACFLAGCAGQDHAAASPLMPTADDVRFAATGLPPILEVQKLRTLSAAEVAIIDTIVGLNPAGAEITRRLLL